MQSHSCKKDILISPRAYMLISFSFSNDPSNTRRKNYIHIYSIKIHFHYCSIFRIILNHLPIRFFILYSICRSSIFLGFICYFLYLLFDRMLPFPPTKSGSNLYHIKWRRFHQNLYHIIDSFLPLFSILFVILILVKFIHPCFKYTQRIQFHLSKLLSEEN